MHYQTRHMEALVDLPHGDRSLLPGDTFFATEIDRGYYLKHGKAKDVEENPTVEVAPPAAAPAPAAEEAAEAQAAAPAPAPSSRRRTAAPAPSPAADSTGA